MINNFGFNYMDPFIGLLTLLFMGVFFGFLLGLIRFSLFSFMKGSPDWGREVKKT